jgi:biotin-dependent carboxylase-like uncharacterized protein
MLTVLRAGPLLTVQDAGRPGLAHLGVPPSGAADLFSYTAANTLVGNDPGAACLEATLGGPALSFDPPALVAVTGAETDARLDGEPLALGEAREGALLELGRCRIGVRAYVAVRGGIAVEPVLGSRSHDLLTGLGPRPLRDGDVVAIGEGAAGSPQTPLGCPTPVGESLIVVPGPRADWFGSLLGTEWRVSPSSNRIGTRLEGPPLPRLRHDELLSEGVVTGAVQVPPSGQPILLGPDHPTTGGYPVVAVVREADLPLVAQLAPDATVQFSIVTSVPIGV